MTVLETIGVGAASRTLAFLVAGGHAVIAHGYARTTFDLDLIIRRTDRDAWVAFLTSLGFGVLQEAPTFLQLTAPANQKWPVDLMLINDATFLKMADEALEVRIGKAAARVVSLRHLIALKCHAIRHGHSGRVVKDMDDLIQIIDANRVDVGSAPIREIMLKYGTHELYEKIRQITARPE